MNISQPSARRIRNAERSAAYLVLLGGSSRERALLFNASQQYLSEVIDDPFVLVGLQRSARPCHPISETAVASAGFVDVSRGMRCFELIETRHGDGVER